MQSVLNDSTASRGTHETCQMSGQSPPIHHPRWFNLCVSPDELRLDVTLRNGQSFGWVLLPSPIPSLATLHGLPSSPLPSSVPPTSIRDFVGVIGNHTILLREMPTTVLFHRLGSLPQIPLTFGQIQSGMTASEKSSRSNVGDSQVDYDMLDREALNDTLYYLRLEKLATPSICLDDDLTSLSSSSPMRTSTTLSSRSSSPLEIEQNSSLTELHTLWSRDGWYSFVTSPPRSLSSTTPLNDPVPAPLPFRGIRMLRQPVFECLLSFICSSNNNISRITKMVDGLRCIAGDEVGKLVCVEYTNREETRNEDHDPSSVDQRRTKERSDQKVESDKGPQSTVVTRKLWRWIPNNSGESLSSTVDGVIRDTLTLRTFPTLENFIQKCPELTDNREVNTIITETNKTSSNNGEETKANRCSGNGDKPSTGSLPTTVDSIEANLSPVLGKKRSRAEANGCLDTIEPPLKTNGTSADKGNPLEADLRARGFGYRAKYICSTLKILQEKGGTAWLESLKVSEGVSLPIQPSNANVSMDSQVSPLKDNTTLIPSSQDDSKTSNSNSNKKMKNKKMAKAIPSISFANDAEQIALTQANRAVSELQTLTGVGRKVADCVALFSLNATRLVPVDTHVCQIVTRDYRDLFLTFLKDPMGFAPYNPSQRTTIPPRSSSDINPALTTALPSMPNEGQSMDHSQVHTLCDERVAKVHLSPDLLETAKELYQSLAPKGVGSTISKDLTTLSSPLSSPTFKSNSSADNGGKGSDQLGGISGKGYELVRLFFQRLFPVHTGWAHSVLFTADLARFSSMRSASTNTTTEQEKGGEDVNPSITKTKNVKTKVSGNRKTTKANTSMDNDDDERTDTEDEMEVLHKKEARDRKRARRS